MLIYLSLVDTPEEKNKFEQLYNAYKYTMQYTAFNILKDSHLSEDAVHEAFIRIAKNFQKIGDVASPQTKGFVIIVVRNVALTMVKQNTNDVIVDDIESVIDISNPSENEAFSDLDFEQIVKTIIDLPELYKDVLYLSLIDECSVSEISSVLNLPKETIKKRLQRGRNILKDKVQRYEVGING